MPSLFGSRNTAFVCMFSHFRAVFTKAGTQPPGTSPRVWPICGHLRTDRYPICSDRLVTPTARPHCTHQRLPKLQHCYFPFPTQSVTSFKMRTAWPPYEPWLRLREPAQGAQRAERGWRAGGPRSDGSACALCVSPPSSSEYFFPTIILSFVFQMRNGCWIEMILPCPS